MIKKTKNQESQQKNNVAASKQRGDYDFLINSGIKQHKSELNKEESLITDLNKEARDLRKIINTTNNFETRSSAEAKLIEIAKKAEEAKQGLRYTYAFDPLTGRRAGTVEEVKNSEDWTSEIKELESEYKSLDLETLEQAYFTHVIEFNDLQEDLDNRIDLGGKALNPFLRVSLINAGYKPDEKGVFKEVAYKDLMRWQDQTVDILQESIYIDPEKKKKSGGATITVNLKDELKDYSQRRNELLKEREAFKLAYLLNVDSGSLSQNFGDVIQRFGETVSEATVGENLTRSTFGVSRRKEIDFLTDLSKDVGIKLTKEQESNAERNIGMKVLEGVGAFVPELAKFAVVNQALGLAGVSARVAQLMASASKTEKATGFVVGALLEEAKFKLVTKGESQTGGGVGFFLGGKLLQKAFPFRFENNLARFNPILEKVVLAGPGGVAGSEVALLTEAVYKELKGSKSFEQSMIDDYGEDSDAMGRIVVNLGVFGLIGGTGLRGRDFKSISSKRALKRKYENELTAIKKRRTLFPDIPVVDKAKQDRDIKQKQNSIALLTKELNVADRSFNSQDISSQIGERNRAQQALESGNLTKAEARSAKETIAKVQGNIEAASKRINSQFEAVNKSGVIGNNNNLIIQEGKQGMFDVTNKAEFDPITNTFIVDILAYKPGVFNQELGHAFFKAAFSNNTKVAKAFKRNIQNTVDKALKDVKFKGENGKEVSFQEAIDFAYGKNRPAEEYVMNVLEYLSKPEYKDLLLKQGLLPGLKRTTLNIAKNIGLDYTNQKDFTTGSQLLEFLFGLGKTFESGNSKNIAKKFKELKDIVIDGEKVINLVDGKEVNNTDVMPSRDIDVSVLAVEYKDKNKEGQKMSDANIKSFQDQYVAIGIEAVSKWAAEKGVPVSAIKNNPDIQGKLIDQLESITKNYKPINSETGKEQSLTTYMYNTLGKRIGPSIVEAYNRLLNERSTDSEFVKELEAGVTESNVDRLAREGLEKDQIDLRDFINNAEIKKES